MKTIKFYSNHDNQQNILFSDTLTWTGEWFGLFYDDISQTGLFSSDFFWIRTNIFIVL
ncbi:hypothetical protein KCU_11538 [Pasteurella multocida subsp. multocida str. P52VAC]|nr:hypothetical protein KCU_11538 [Pasteurella multocida subsp. multocida str. P52VAC]